MSQDTFMVQRMGTEEGPYTFMDLQMMVRSGQVKSQTLLRKEAGGNWFPAKEVPSLFSEKEWIVALLISFFLGGLGIDRFYLGHGGLGVLKLLTLGGVGIWALVDFVLIALDKVKDGSGLPLRR